MQWNIFRIGLLQLVVQSRILNPREQFDIKDRTQTIPVFLRHAHLANFLFRKGSSLHERLTIPTSHGDQGR